MINLLPQDKIVRNAADYRRRRLMVAATLFSALLLVSLVITITSDFILWSRWQTIASQIKSSAQNQDQAEFNQLEQTLTTLDHRARRLGNLSAPADIGLAKTLKTIASRQTSGMSLTNIGYTPTKAGADLTLAGTASTRHALLTFLDSLQAEPSFSQVESPISNLIKDTNINFSLSLQVNPPHHD